LEQDLVLAILQSLNQFDPEQGHLNVFITTVVERRVATILRERRAKKRDGGVVRSLGGRKDDQSTDPIDPRSGHERQVDFANDLAEALARLPEELRDLAELLKRQSLSEVSRDLGVPRTTLQRQKNRLRQCFEDAGLHIYL
jgi:RNA polymerase sigma-70 factor (ECF subfamily)